MSDNASLALERGSDPRAIAPHPLVYIKSVDLRLMYANEAADEVLSACWECAGEIGERIQARRDALERRVLRRRKQVGAVVEALFLGSNDWRWYLCKRWPIFDRASRLIGLAACMQPAASPQRALADIDVAALAAALHMSRRDFITGLNSDFRLSDVQARTQSRLQRSFAWLRDGRPLAWTAQAAGFDSSSAFAKSFRTATGIAPSFYQSMLG